MSMSISMLINRFKSVFSRDEALKILMHWAKGEPIRGLSVEKLRYVMIKWDSIEEFIRRVIKQLEEYNFSGIYGVVGEFGFGKTQMCYILEDVVRRGKEYVTVEFMSLTSVEDIDLLADKLDRVHPLALIIVDELDSLLGSVTEEARREIIHKLASVLVLKAKGGKSVVLALTERTMKWLVECDERFRRLSPNTIPLSREVISERDIADLARIILALMFRCNMIGELQYTPGLIDLLVDWAYKYAEIEAGRSLGYYIRQLTQALMEYSKYKVKLAGVGSFERSKIVEGLVRSYLKHNIRSLKVDIRVSGRELKPYTAVYRGKVKVGDVIPDIVYEIYPGKYAFGRRIANVILEVKCGGIDAIKNSYGQLSRYLSYAPILILWVGANGEEEIEKYIKASFEKYRDRVEYVYIPLRLLEPFIYLDDSYKAFVQVSRILGLDEDLKFKIEESLRSIIYSAIEKPVKIPTLMVIKAGVKPPEKPVKEDYARLADMLIVKARLSSGKAIYFARVTKRIREILGNKISEVNAQFLAKEVLVELTRRGFLERRSERVYRAISEAWRARRDEAVEIIANLIRKYSK